MSTVPASFYVTGGTLRPDAPSYVDRKADADLLEGLIAAEFCYVLTSRQMGKSSLMVRTANKLRERAVHVIVLDLSSLGQNMTREQWYNGLLATMGDQLRMEDELYEFWTTHEALSPVQRWFKALEKKVLPKRPGSVVVFIDEIDVVRSLPFSTDEFFAAIRECYNRRALDPEFCRLTFCLLGVATPGDLVRNTNITPFNIGRRIDLDDFTSEEAKPLARGLHTEGSCALKLLARVLHWTSGHPYLTQRLCHAWARDPETNKPGDVDRLCGELFLTSRARERDDNLIFVRDRLLRSDVDLTDLLELYLKAWSRRTALADDASPLVGVLRLSGVVRVEGGRVTERNRIYHRVFDRSWVKASLPDAESRRQQAAFRRGVVRTTAIASIVIGVMTVILIAADTTKKARAALAEAHFSQAQRLRLSGSAGQRYESVTALEAASRYYTNRAALRDELVSCLALPDLKEISGKYRRPQGPEIYELSPERGICATAKTDGTILVQRLDDGAVVKSLPGFGSSPKRLRFGRDPEMLLVEYQSDSSTQTVVWNWPEGTRLFTIPHGIHAEAIDFSMDGKKLAVSQSGGLLTVYSLPGGEILYGPRKLRLNSGFPRLLQVLRFDPSGNYLAECCLDDIDVQIWNIADPRKRSPVLLSHNDRVYDLSWHSAGEVLATACGDSAVYLWSTTRPERAVTRLAGHERRVSAVAFNHRGTQLASVSDDETVRLWTPAAPERPVVFRLEAENLKRLRFSANDTELFASGGEPFKHRVWEVAGSEYVSLRVEAGSRDPLRSIDFSPDGRWLAASTGERTTIWDARKGAESGLASTTNNHAAAFSADSHSLIVCTGKDLSRYVLSDISVGNQPRLLAGFSCTLSQAAEPFRAMTLALNRTSAAVVLQQNVLMISLRTNCSTQLRTIPVGTSYHRLALHPSGNWLAASFAGSGLVDIWNLAENITVRAITRPTSSYFLFSSDEKWLVTCWGGAFQFYRVGLWTNATFEIPRESSSDQHAPVAFSGSIVALASSRYKIQLFHLSSNESSPPKPFVTLEGPDHDPLEMLAFSPDGRRLAVGTANNTVQLWNLALVRDDLARSNLEKEWPAYQ